MRVLRAIVCLLLLTDAARAEPPLRVVATTSDLRSLVEYVGGDRVAVTSLVPAQLDAEDYQPKPRDVTHLRDAALVVRVGLDYDIWLDRLLQQAGDGELRRGGKRYVDASASIAVLEVRGATVGAGDGHAHGSGNPHYWLDPKNAEVVTATILEALTRVDPANAAAYDANRRNFLAKLSEKLAEWETKAAAIRGQPIVAYHNSWAYFARRFKLNIIGLIEPRPGVPAGPAQFAKLVATMRDAEARIILRESRESEKDAKFLAGRTGAQLIVLAGSVGALPAATDYLALFDTNIAALAAVARP